MEEKWWKLWYPQCAAGLIFYRRGDDVKVQDNDMVLLLTVTEMGKGNTRSPAGRRCFKNQTVMSGWSRRR